jgi:hypothetical protein
MYGNGFAAEAKSPATPLEKGWPCSSANFLEELSGFANRACQCDRGLCCKPADACKKSVIACLISLPR